MPDNLNSTGGQDRDRISLEEDYEVRDWAAKFGVTPDDVRAAVKAVGDRAEAVKEYLHTHHASTGSDH